MGAIAGALLGAAAFATQTYRWTDSRWPNNNQPDQAVKYLSTMGISIDADDMRTASDEVCNDVSGFKPEEDKEEDGSPVRAWGQLADEVGTPFYQQDSFAVEDDSDYDGEGASPAKRAAVEVAVEAAVTYACPQYLPDMYSYSQQL